MVHSPSTDPTPLGAALHRSRPAVEITAWCGTSQPAPLGRSTSQFPATSCQASTELPDGLPNVMAKHRFRTGLAVVGACAALSVVAPPLAGMLNAVGSLTLLALAAYAAYRSWAFLESLVEASRRPATIRRNLGGEPERSPERNRERSTVEAPSLSRTAPERRTRSFRFLPQQLRERTGQGIRDR